MFDCSGESMENALRACCKGIKIGKILIHRDGDNGQQVECSLHTFIVNVHEHSTLRQFGE
jgi:uracil phosphoribosyltransferase